MIEDGRTIGDAVDARSFSNAATMLHAVGGSTNAVIHLPAIAEGFGVHSGRSTSGRNQQRPSCSTLKPAGKFIMVDLYEKAGGLSPLARYMIDQGLLDPTGSER